ncbi:MAG TPA: CrcB family protein [Phycisphaerae bacterium]
MNKYAILTWAGIAVAGAAGSLARFGVAQAFRIMTDYPAGTLTVNLAGAFALGWVNASFKPDGGMSEAWRLVLGVGLLGGFTTFSSMMFDADKMLLEASYIRASAYVAASLFLGLLAVRLGAMMAGKSA